jgi:hypothetical protein
VSAIRTYGRSQDAYGNKTWVVVQTDANGFNDAVYVTTLIQCLLLNLGESPFYANYGIPAQQSLITQVMPDYYVLQTQSQFSAFFASLQVAKLNNPNPTYQINIITNSGAKVDESVPVI